MRKAIIKIDSQIAGWLTQDDEGYHFEYEIQLNIHPNVYSLTTTGAK